MLQSEEHFLNYCRYALALGWELSRLAKAHPCFFLPTCKIRGSHKSDVQICPHADFNILISFDFSQNILVYFSALHCSSSRNLNESVSAEDTIRSSRDFQRSKCLLWWWQDQWQLFQPSMIFEHSGLVCDMYDYIIEGSLEVKLPTIWTDEAAEMRRGREEKEIL